MSDSSAENNARTITFGSGSAIESISLRYSDTHELCGIVIRRRRQNNIDLDAEASHHFWESLGHSPQQNGLLDILSQTPDDYPKNPSEMNHWEKLPHFHKLVHHRRGSEELLMNHGNDFDYPRSWTTHTLTPEYNGGWMKGGNLWDKDGNLVFGTAKEPVGPTLVPWDEDGNSTFGSKPVDKKIYHGTPGPIPEELLKKHIPERKTSSGYLSGDYVAVVSGVDQKNVPNVAAKIIRVLHEKKLVGTADAHAAHAALGVAWPGRKSMMEYFKHQKKKYTDMVRQDPPSPSAER